MINLGIRAQTVDEDLEEVLEVIELVAEQGWDDLHVRLQMATDVEALSATARARLQGLQEALGAGLEVTAAPEASPPGEGTP